MDEQTQNPTKILRRSIHTFLTHFHRFNSTPTLLALPFSLSLLLHLSTNPATTATIHRRLHSVFLAAGYPLSSSTSQFLILKLSQTISSSLSSLPFSFSFLLLSKSATLHSLKSLQSNSPQPPNDAFFPILLTHFCNLFLLIAANSACFSLLCFAFTSAAGSHFDYLPAWISAAGAVFYSVVVANAIVVCNLALISSGWEGTGGFSSIVKAWALIRGKTATALVLALPTNLAMAAVEVVFRYRIYGGEERWIWAVAAEAVLIAYLYSTLVVGDTIVGCLFYQSCKEDVGDWDSDVEAVYPSDPHKLKDLEDGF